MSAGEIAANPTSSAQARHSPGLGRMLMLGPLGVEASKGATCSASPLPGANENRTTLVLGSSARTTDCLPESGVVISSASCLIKYWVMVGSVRRLVNRSCSISSHSS